MILLALVRHAHANSIGHDGTDHGRSLTSEGRGAAARTGGYLAERFTRRAQILCSPKVRAVETATILAETLGASEPRVIPCLQGGIDSEAILHGVAGHAAGPTILVGHEPDLGRLLARLLDPAWFGSIPLPPAGCALVEVSSLPPHQAGRLISFGP